MKRTSIWLLLILGAGAAARVLYAAAVAPEGPLRAVENAARLALWDNEEKHLKRYQSVERLRKELRYISAELDREVVDLDRDLDAYSQGGLARIKYVRDNGNLDSRLDPALDRLERIFADLPKKDFARSYGGDLYEAISRELVWIADEAQDEETLLGLLETHLELSEDAPGEGPAAENSFPEDLPLAKFKALGPIKIFMVKHRTNRPKTYVSTTDKALVAGKHNVQIGVAVEGKVTYANLFFWDQDYTFNIGDLHMEITPEWRLKHKDFPKPRVGDTVRVKGWTYYDNFHKAEHEYDPQNPVLGANRATLWEIHPVLELEIVSGAK